MFVSLSCTLHLLPEYLVQLFILSCLQFYMYKLLFYLVMRG